MKLYITEGSPYARMVRIVILEKGLADRVEIILAPTRLANSPYYQINPSGRVPYLIRDDGVAMEESGLIAAYLDHLDGKPQFDWPPGNTGWEARRIDALVHSLLDGLAVWSRELARPPNERSPTTLAHEAARATRMMDLWEATIGHPVMHGPLNLAQIALACALGHAGRVANFKWRDGHAKLGAWFDTFARRPSFAATAVQPRT
jgi:glutathione S-transferase